MASDCSCRLRHSAWKFRRFIFYKSRWVKGKKKCHNYLKRTPVFTFSRKLLPTIIYTWKFKRFIFYNNPKSWRIPPSACSGTPKPIKSAKGRATERCLALTTRCGRVRLYNRPSLSRSMWFSTKLKQTDTSYIRPHQLDFMFLGFCGSCFSQIEKKKICN